jgi:serine O-acetyltransferase
MALFHRIRTKWGIEISRSASIGPGCYIGHFGGIVVGPAIIGRHCSISQGVTIGVSGRGEHEGLPTIGDNVYLAPGAKLFGKISIGHNVKVGANAVVYKDVSNNAVVAAPGFIILSHEGNQR